MMELKNFDKILFFSVLTVLSIGILMLYSASREYQGQHIVFRQLSWIFVGLVLLFIVARIDYQRFIAVSYLLYGVTLFFLIFVLFFGQTRGGAQRWISLGVFNLQPSEFAKVTLVLALSSYIGRRRKSLARIGFFLGVLMLVIPVFTLVFMEPNLGSALLLIPIPLVMLLMVGVKATHLIGIISLGLSAIPFFWQFLKDYQKQRLFVFVNPNIDPLGSGYTIIQSKIAVGSGGLWGKGWLGGTQSQLNFLPERHTDFIFSVVGEEWGFLGALILIFLYFLIIYRGIKIIETTPDVYGRLVAGGFVTLFSFQVIINIGMTIGLLPIVGLPLPLISYGGSSLIATLLYIGLLLNIGRERSLF